MPFRGPRWRIGSRSIYKDGWKAAYAYKPSAAPTNSFASTISVANPDQNDWQLYNLNDDFNKRIDLAKKNPQKLEELKALFEEQAQKYNLYPYITWDDVLKRRVLPLIKQEPAKAESKGEK